MGTQWHAGSRIRERRLDLGLRQAAVAEAAGISASYLNLIEHNRRRIGGKLLTDLARALAIDPALLAEGADRALVDQLREAAAHIARAASPAEDLARERDLKRAEEFAARFPGWAGLVARQAGQITALQAEARALSDRLGADPALAHALHEVISAVTAIRSSASILVGAEPLDPDWQMRFHENIYHDSGRLSESSAALMAFLDAPEATPDIRSPLAEVTGYLADQAYHFAALEDAPSDPEATLKAAVAAAELSPAAATLLRAQLDDYLRRAQVLPLARFSQAARDLAYDPAALAAHFDVAFQTVLLRLASLPEDDGHPPMGLVVADAAGALLAHKPVLGFSMARTAGLCPLWPVFTAFGRPHQPVRQAVVLPGAMQTPVLCYAIAAYATDHHFDAPQPMQSVMLAVPEPAISQPTPTPTPLGLTCRICPRQHCTSRREPMMEGL